MRYLIRASVLIGLLAAQPIFAQETQVTGIHASDSLGSNFSMLIFSTGLGRFGPAVYGNTEKSNLHFRLAISKSENDSNFNSVPGLSTDDTRRLLLAYAMQLSENTTTTLTGGVSNHRIKVSPVTASSPSDTDKWGPFVSADIYAYFGDRGSVFALAEYDGPGKVYAMASYVKTLGIVDIGPSNSYSLGTFNIGPSITYSLDGDYQRASLGVISSHKLAKNVELTLSGGKVTSRVDNYPEKYGTYFDVIFKIGF